MCYNFKCMIDFFENILVIALVIFQYILGIALIVFLKRLFCSFISNPFKKKKNDGDNLDDLSWYDAAHDSDNDYIIPPTGTIYR